MRLVYSALHFNEEGQNWKIGENETCLYNPSLYASPIFATALAQLQVFRSIFEFFPQPFLRFNHEAWAYPVAALAPVTACVLQGLVFYYKGTICDHLPIRLILRRLNFQFRTTSRVARIQATTLMFLLIVFLEILIQSKKIKRLLQFWTRKQKNKIQPALFVTSSNLSRIDCSNGPSTMNLTPNTIELGNLASGSQTVPNNSVSNLNNGRSSTEPSINDSVIQIQHHAKELNMFVIIVVIFVVILIYNSIFGRENMIKYIPMLALDFFYFVLPSFVVLNSTKISDLIKHRFVQFSIRHGKY